MAAAAPVLLAALLTLLAAPPSSISAAAPYDDTLPRRSRLVVEEYETQILRSPDGTFSCGFHQVYEGAFTFSVWYSGSTPTVVVWSANRGSPVRSSGSAITLRKDGTLALTDYDGTVVWQAPAPPPPAAGNSNTGSFFFPGDVVERAQLLDTGNLVLTNSTGGAVWRSFDSPTDTFLPTQPITDRTTLVSTSPGLQDVPGHYIFCFSDESMLSLIYDDTNVTGVYWPDPDFEYYQNNRNLNNSTRTASLDEDGQFFSSDFATNHVRDASDKGALGIKRRLKLDEDGNLRLYSLNLSSLHKNWTVSWIAEAQPCLTHGLCGPYGICHYWPAPTCSCPPGYEMRNPGNWTQGCKPTFDIPCAAAAAGGGEQEDMTFTFLELRDTDFWGSDQQRIDQVSLDRCWNACISDCTCKGFQYQRGNGTCYPKSFLFNGRSFPTPTVRTMYIKLPSTLNTSGFIAPPHSDVLNSAPRHLQCAADHPPAADREEQLLPSSNSHSYSSQSHKAKKGTGVGEMEPRWLYLYGFIGAFFVIEVFFFAFAWFFVLRRGLRSSTAVWAAAEAGYKMMASHFRVYSYGELVKATQNFRHELGWGSGGTGVAYKGTLDDGRSVVVKRLGNNIRHSREEFHDELHVIARINHMNLVRICGFCSQRSHRMLVLQYAENGSLADALFRRKISLGWSKRFSIALGVAKGLAYLHHECKEWIIHCNLKPENILLDQDLEPKIADFGLAKLLSRSGSGPDQNVSRARGTVGYIAPEWISGLPITAKVDVYSYGVVLLELVSGARVFDLVKGEDEKVRVMLKKFIKVLSYRLDREEPFWLAEFVDFKLGGEFSYLQVKVLIKLAISCLEEERKKRPTMESIVECLLSADLTGNQ